MTSSQATERQSQCDLLRSLHRPGDPLPVGPQIAELAALGIARLSWGPLLHWDALARFKDKLATLR